MTKHGTDVSIDVGMVPSYNKLAPCMVQKGGLVGGKSRKRVLRRLE